MDNPRDRTDRGWIARWLAVCSFGIGLLRSRFVGRGARQFVATVAVLALAITSMLVVTGIAIELGDDPAVESDADLRIVPHGGATLSSVIDVEGARLSAVHDRSARIAARDDVAGATPVLVDVVRMRAPGSDEPAYVLAIGVVPDPDAPTVVGLSTDGMEPGDPHYADGRYDGEYTGDVLLSGGAAEQLNATAGDELRVQRSGGFGVAESHAVVDVETAEGSVAAGRGLPIAVFRLGELQAITGANEGDLADQIAVSARGDGSDVDLASADSNATVVREEGAFGAADALRTDELAMALSVATLTIGLGVCVLVIATTMGIVVEGDRRTLAVLAVLGFHGRARLVVVAATVLGTTAIGATLGVLGGAIGVRVINAVARAFATPESIASIGAWAVPYAYAVAIVAGVLATPYPLAVANRTNVTEDLR